MAFIALPAAESAGYWGLPEFVPDGALKMGPQACTRMRRHEIDRENARRSVLRHSAGRFARLSDLKLRGFFAGRSMEKLAGLGFLNRKRNRISALEIVRDIGRLGTGQAGEKVG